MVPEVCIYFDFQLFRGNRTVKRNSEQFSAFHFVNYPALAIAGWISNTTTSLFTSILGIPGLRGVVLETFGSGNVPTSGWLIKAVKDAVHKGVIIIKVTQCEGGRGNMGQYETSIELLESGVISGKDMTTEAAITKLMFLLGQNIGDTEIKMCLNKALRGEISG